MGSRVVRAAVLVVAASLFFTLIGSAIPAGFGMAPAQASSLSQARSDLAKAKKQLASLQAKLDKLAKQQSDAEADLESTQDEIAAVQGRIDTAMGDLTALRQRLASRLAEMYKNRGSDGSDLLNVIFAGDETSITAVIERLAMVSHIAGADKKLVNSVVAKVRDLKAMRADLQAQKTAEVGKNSTYVAARERTLASLENAKDDYNTLRKKVTQLAEAARQAELAAQQAAEAKAAAAAASKTTGTTTRKTTTTTEHKVTVTGDFVFPVDGPNSFSDTFGAPRSGGRTHQGCDIFTARNTPLVACVSGTITSTNPTDSGLGGITIHLKKGTTTYYYAHLSSIKAGIHAGVKVTAGQVIGYAGNTGNASGGAVHLHFEIRPNGVAIDPYPILIQYR